MWVEDFEEDQHPGTSITSSKSRTLLDEFGILAHLGILVDQIWEALKSRIIMVHLGKRLWK